MIQVTRIGGSIFRLNAAMIELVEATPDTVITMVSGKKYVVIETVDQVVEAMTTFYHCIGIIGACTDSRRGPEHDER
jgi:flagellar protein FlbD